MHELIWLRTRLLEIQETRIKILGNGAAKDYPDYRQRSGEITGLALGIVEIEDLLKNMENANE